MRMLIAEDDPLLADGLTRSLAQMGFAVDHATDGAAADHMLLNQNYDLVILDLGLPKIDGFEVLRRLRRRDGPASTAPVLILTARDELEDRVRGLDLGADDYLTKPFGVAEMMARVRAALRRGVRPADAEGAIVRFADVTVDLDRRTVTRAGAEVHLTPVEFRLLAMLLAHPGRLMTHRRLLLEVWGPSHADDVHYLRVHMGHLRRKLEATPARPRHLVTDTGVGYRFVPER